MLRPPRLTIDDTGVEFRTINYRKRIAWSDVERIGVAQRAKDVVSRFSRSRVTELNYAPRIGIDYKTGHNPINDTGKASYRRSFFGFDIAWPNEFDCGLSSIIERMQQRLDASRASTASVDISAA